VAVWVLALAAPLVAGTFSPPHAGTPTPPSTALLTDVLVANLGTFDRVTFVFRGGNPGVLEVSYFSGPAILAPQAEPLEPPLLGNARFRLTLSGASGFDLSMDPFVDTYPGPDRIQPDLPALVDLARTEDFEATLQWTFGLRDGEVPAEVRVESGPTRVVVDIPHTVLRPVVGRPTFTG
jgi:hypothetical protein